MAILSIVCSTKGAHLLANRRQKHVGQVHPGVLKGARNKRVLPEYDTLSSSFLARFF